MAISLQNPLATFDNALIKSSKFLMVKTFAMQQAKNATKSEEKVKDMIKSFQRDIHSGSTNINVRI